MAKRKLAVDYEKDIRSLHRQLPDANVEKQIAHRVNKWIELAPLRIQVANNEKIPWSSSMLGFATEKMRPHNVSGFYNIGDYNAIINTSGGDRYIDTVIERKSIPDLYGTIVPEDNRARFYREIERFAVDERFNSMMILVEGSFTDFILHQPEFNGKGFDYTRQFDTKKNNTINEKKLTIMSDLYVLNIPIIFGDNPTLAAQLCGRLFRQRIRKNYAHILGL